MIEGKIVRLGNSVAISIKKKDMVENNLKFSQTVQFSVINPKKAEALKKLFGAMKGAKPFRREEKDREF